MIGRRLTIPPDLRRNQRASTAAAASASRNVIVSIVRQAPSEGPGAYRPDTLNAEKGGQAAGSA